MGWWKRFMDWLDEENTHALFDPAEYKFDQWPKEPKESPLKEWNPALGMWLPSVPPTQAECSDESSPVESTAPVAEDGQPDEPESVESDECGNEIIEPTLEHADHLPSTTFRVFPTTPNHRNSYDTERSVRQAVAQRRRWRWWENGERVPVTTKVYRTYCIWVDVTDEYVKG